MATTETDGISVLTPGEVSALAWRAREARERLKRLIASVTEGDINSVRDLISNLSLEDEGMWSVLRRSAANQKPPHVVMLAYSICVAELICELAVERGKERGHGNDCHP